MSVTAVNPYENTEGGVDSEGVRTYSNDYHVYTDDKDDGSVTARMGQAIALGLPAYGDYWTWYNDYDLDAICKTRRATLLDVESTRKIWMVTCGFTTKLQKRDPANEQGDPVNEPWKISGSFANGTRTVDRDKDGKVLTNSAEEPLLEEIPTGHDTLILEGNTATIDLAVRAAAKLKTNSDPMWGLDARQWLLMQWTYEVLYKANTPYIRNRLEFHAANDDGDNDKWDLVFVDHGTRTIVDATETDPKLRYKPASAQDIQLLGGVYLDGSGGALDLVANPDGHKITKEVIREYNFLANLGFLPNPLPGPFV